MSTKERQQNFDDNILHVNDTVKQKISKLPYIQTT